MTRRRALIFAAAVLVACGGGERDPGTPADLPATGGGRWPGGVGALRLSGAPSGLSGAGTAGAGGTLAVAATPGAVTLARVWVEDPPLPPAWSRPPLDLGVHPLVIDRSGTIEPLGTLRDAEGHAATALWVKPGVTATVGVPAAGWAGFALQGPIIVEGTLEVGRIPGAPLDAGSLYATAALLAVGPRGLLTASGGGASPSSEPGTKGGNGGQLRVSAPDVFVFGRIEAAGGDGATGGSGGTVVLGGGDLATVGAGDVVVQGSIRATGGTGLEGAAGRGGEVTLGGLGAAVHVEGSVSVSGGAGTAGGDGGEVLVQGGRAVVVAGVVDASGGHGRDGLGGHGGRVDIGPGSEGVWLTGIVAADGGSSDAGRGAPGGAVRAGLATRATTPGPLVLAGYVTVDGGRGTDGGAGGSIELSGGDVRACLDVVWALGGAAYAGGAPGRGGDVDVASATGPSAVDTLVSVASLGGTAHGSVRIDGVEAPLQQGTYWPGP